MAPSAPGLPDPGQGPGGLRAGALKEVRDVFLQAILIGQRRLAVDAVLEARRQGHALTDIYIEIFQESLYEVGRLWERRNITVAQEHMATAITEWAIAQLYPSIELAANPRGSVVITGVQGERHQVGARLVSDALEANGWNVRFLGTDVPPDGVLQVIDEHGAGLLGISVTMRSNLPHVRHLVAAVRQRFGESAPRVVLGGAAVRDTPELAEELAAEGIGRDVRSAVEMCARFVR